MKTRRNGRSAVAGIIAAVILFALLFTVGLGFFLNIDHMNQQVSNSQDAKSTQEQAALAEVKGLQLPVIQLNNITGDIQFTVTNDGSAASTIESIFIVDESGVSHSIFPGNSSTPLPVTVNPQTTSDLVNTNVPCALLSPLKSCVVTIATALGNLLSGSYPASSQTGGQTTGTGGSGGSSGGSSGESGTSGELTLGTSEFEYYEPPTSCDPTDQSCVLSGPTPASTVILPNPQQGTPADFVVFSVTVTNLDSCGRVVNIDSGSIQQVLFGSSSQSNPTWDIANVSGVIWRSPPGPISAGLLQGGKTLNQFNNISIPYGGKVILAFIYGDSAQEYNSNPPDGGDASTATLYLEGSTSGPLSLGPCASAPYGVSIGLGTTFWAEESTTTIQCSPAQPVFGRPTTCTAYVAGTNPTGTVTWGQFGDLGEFTPSSTCSLARHGGGFQGYSYSCFVTYTPITSISTESITAAYWGDLGNEGSGGTFTLDYVKASPSLTTTLYLTTGSEYASNNPPQAGQSLYDIAVLSDGAQGASGTVTFAYYTNNNCNGQNTTVGTSTPITTINGSGTVQSVSVPFPVKGSFSWQATYSGDPHDNRVSECTALNVIGGDGPFKSSGGSIVKSYPAGSTSESVTLTTTASEFIYACEYTVTNSGGGYTLSITGGGLNWVSRGVARNSNPSGGEIGCWYATAQQASTPITFASSANSQGMVVYAFGFTGVDPLTPFDTNPSVPTTSPSGSSTTSCTQNMPTSNPSDIIISIVGITKSQSITIGGSPGTYTPIGTISGPPSGAAEDQVVAQTGRYSPKFSWTSSDYCVMFTDAIDPPPVAAVLNAKADQSAVLSSQPSLVSLSLAFACALSVAPRKSRRLAFGRGAWCDSAPHIVAHDNLGVTKRILLGLQRGAPQAIPIEHPSTRVWGQLIRFV